MYLSFFTFFFFFFFEHLYWGIIALQWCVSFCFITKFLYFQKKELGLWSREVPGLNPGSSIQQLRALRQTTFLFEP